MFVVPTATGVKNPDPLMVPIAVFDETQGVTALAVGVPVNATDEPKHTFGPPVIDGLLFTVTVA